MIDPEALITEKESGLYWFERKVPDSSISADKNGVDFTQYEYNPARVPVDVIDDYELEGI